MSTSGLDAGRSRRRSFSIRPSSTRWRSSRLRGRRSRSALSLRRRRCRSRRSRRACPPHKIGTTGAMLPLPLGGAPHLFALAAIAALVGGLAAVERKGAFQLMLSRPLVLSAILGWALGDARGGLLLGVPLELLFLGGVNLGGNLPDNESLLAGALISMVVPAGIAAATGVDPSLATMGLA